jgi:hypothetical protein
MANKNTHLNLCGIAKYKSVVTTKNAKKCNELKTIESANKYKCKSERMRCYL